MSDAPVLHRGVSKTSCRSCSKPIVFAESSSTGKLAPFEEDDAGLFVIENGKARYVGTPDKTPAQLELGAPPPEKVQRWTSHFATCPHQASWRKPR